ncbi:MAG TPA: biotin synthase [Clostridiales bacterium]|nr:biotin synthase [Clostridiales bacterium]
MPTFLYFPSNLLTFNDINGMFILEQMFLIRSTGLHKKGRSYNKLMTNIHIPQELNNIDKLLMMEEDAKYEVTNDLDAECTAVFCANDIKGQHQPPKIPKMFLASKCIFNCAYCGCRCSREERPNYCNSPKELAQLSVNAAKNNGHGVFVTSAIYKNADYTQELLAECVRIMREDLGYKDFIHAKIMPGADPMLIAKTGQYANRLSVNIEVAHSSGYQRIAKQKNKSNIMTPMSDIAQQIIEAKYEKRDFATSQTTQLMAGSMNEDDRTIIILSKALYKKYHLKRIYYTAFHYTHPAKGYENENLSFTETPRWRMTRLYQADRLLQLYHFTPDDLTPESHPFLEPDIDPKAAWALRHLQMYPVEVNKADFETLLRVPGIGITYAKRIIEARRHCIVTHDLLRKMRIPLKRCIYFITCNGRYKGENILSSSPELRNRLAQDPDC